MNETHTLNGIKYVSRLITEEEKAVVEAMRLGAEIDVSFFNLKELKEVDERMEIFAGIETDKFCWIKEKEHKDGERYISFIRGMNKIGAACYLEVKKD